MGIESHKAVYDSSTPMAPKHQGYINARNIEDNNNFDLTSLHDNNNNNAQINNDSRIGKHNFNTSSLNSIHPQNTNPPNRNKNTDLVIFHQNIRGLCNKIDELLNTCSTEFPHLLCFRVHHLCDQEINSKCIKYYKLGAKYCRRSCKYGGVSIFVHETLLFSTLELNKFCKDQDLEVHAVKSYISSFVLCVLCVYRPPTGNFFFIF
jgi:hypothetical protein